MTRHPTRDDVEVITAYLGGYIEQGGLTAITLDTVRQLLRTAAPDVDVDGMTISRLLRRLGFNRSYLPADAGTTTYRKAA